MATRRTSRAAPPQSGAGGAHGYSGTPLAKKLGIREGARVLCLGAPAGFAIDALPAGAALTTAAGKGGFSVVLAFVRRAAELAPRFERASKLTGESGAVWVAWPKKSSGVATDVTEDVLRAVILPTGYVDTKVCAIDATWSGLRFVLRVANRGTAR